MKTSFFPKHEFIDIQTVNKFKETVISVPTTSKVFSFQSKIQMKDKLNKKITKNLSVCLDNSVNLHFQGIKSMVQLLKSLLCRDPNDCDGEEDLNIFDDNDTAIMVTIDGHFYNSKDNKGKYFIA